MERALTIRSSRARFAVSVVTGPHRAARLNSGVSSQKKWFSAKSFLFAKAKELPAPLSPALRHISDLIRLRAVKHFLASRQSRISGS